MTQQVAPDVTSATHPRRPLADRPAAAGGSFRHEARATGQTREHPHSVRQARASIDVGEAAAATTWRVAAVGVLLWCADVAGSGCAVVRRDAMAAAVAV